MLGLGSVVCLLLLIGMIWHVNMAARERANAAAHEVCARNDLSLLDGTVALATLRVTRGPDGRWGVCRIYRFDYCEDGQSRSSGFIIVHGRRIEAVGLASVDPSGLGPLR